MMPKQVRKCEKTYYKTSSTSCRHRLYKLNSIVNPDSFSSSKENKKNKRKPYAYGDRMAAAAVATMRDILIELQGGPADCTEALG